MIARHVLEHSHHPEKLIAELKRVGRAGYIATPSPFTEIVHGGYQHANGMLNSSALRRLQHGAGTPGHRWFVLKSENHLVLLPKSKELYPIYLILGYFVKHNTRYRKDFFFKKHPEWLETQLAYKNKTDLQIVVLDKLEEESGETVDVDQLISQVEVLCRNKRNQNLLKHLVRKLLFSTTQRFKIGNLIACPICQTRLIKFGSRMVCSECGEFPVVNDVPILLREAFNS